MMYRGLNANTVLVFDYAKMPRVGLDESGSFLGIEKYIHLIEYVLPFF